MTRLVVKPASASSTGSSGGVRQQQVPQDSQPQQAGSVPRRSSHVHSTGANLMHAAGSGAIASRPPLQCTTSHSEVDIFGAASRAACSHIDAYDSYGVCPDSPAKFGGSHGYSHDEAGLDIAEAGAARRRDGEDFWGNDGNDSCDDEYNSADEADSKGRRGAAGKGREHGMDECELEKILSQEKGFRIKRMEEDGNCLFRAIADQIYGDSGMHHEVHFASCFACL